MSPREQIAAVRLLIRWRELFSTLTSVDVVQADQLLEMAKSIQKLEDETDAFIQHGPGSLT